MARVWFPRLSKGDVEELMRAHQAIVALDRTLRDAKWAGANACIILAGQADQVIARIYNKADAAIQRWSSRESTQTPQEAPAAASTDATATEGEFVPPGKAEA